MLHTLCCNPCLCACVCVFTAFCGTTSRGCAVMRCRTNRVHSRVFISISMSLLYSDLKNIPLTLPQLCPCPRPCRCPSPSPCCAAVYQMRHLSGGCIRLPTLHSKASANSGKLPSTLLTRSRCEACCCAPLEGATACPHQFCAKATKN